MLPTKPLLIFNAQSALIAWMAVLALGASAMIVGLLGAGFGVGQPIAVAVLAVVAIAAERQSIGLSSTVEVSVASLLYVFAAVVFGPLAGVIVGASGLLADLPRRDVEQPILRWATWTSIRIVVAGAALTR
jgi:hypothetical protein